MLVTLGLFLVDAVAQIVSTGTLILLKAVEMAAQCISWILWPWGGRTICRCREYLVENTVHVMLSIFKFCSICLNTTKYYTICKDNIIFLSWLVLCFLLLKWMSSLAMRPMPVLSSLFSATLAILRRIHSGCCRWKSPGEALRPNFRLRSFFKIWGLA